MTDAARLLKMVKETGPRKRRVLEYAIPRGAAAFRQLLQSGALVVIGKKRGAKYGTPEQAKKNRSTS